MNNDFYLKTGCIFYGVAIAAIGIIHFITGHFPNGLLSLPASFAGKSFLVYLTGALLILSGTLIASEKYIFQGSLLAILVWLALFILIHLPNLIMHYKMFGDVTPATEILSVLSGALILRGGSYQLTEKPKIKDGFNLALVRTGVYLFAFSLIIYALLHYVYADFVATLIPSWIPARLFWSYFTMAAFFFSGISFLIQKLVRLSSVLLAAMFFSWFLILHLPRVINKPMAETEWTSLFLVLAMSGVSLLAGFSELRRSVQVKGSLTKI